MTYACRGYLEELPLLNYRRWNHACAGFYNHAGKFVLLVAGGTVLKSEFMFYPSASTESLEVGSTRWIENSPLPQKIDGLRAATVDNKIFVIGKRRHPSNSKVDLWSLTLLSYLKHSYQNERKKSAYQSVTHIKYFFLDD